MKLPVASAHVCREFSDKTTSGTAQTNFCTPKSGGKPAVLTPETPGLRNWFHVESLSWGNYKLNSDQLEVRKAGFAPALLVS
jgi:hypothetical protein